jgi:predicted kinase
MKTLVLLRGLPGSGKTTLAQTLCKPNASWTFSEADSYFGIGPFYRFDPKKLPDAHKACQEAVLSAFRRQDCDVVFVTNTSSTEEEVEVYRRIADEVGATFVSLIVENRHGNKSVHGVPERTIERMLRRFSVKL